MNKKDFYLLLQRIPKSEIHIHAEAIVSKKTIKILYKRNFNQDITNENIEKMFIYENLSEFIESFLEVQCLFKTASDFNLLFDDISLYLEQNNIVYCELFLSPSTFLKNGILYEDILSILTSRIEQLALEKKIIVKLIIDLSRTFGYVNALNNYLLVKKHPSSHIIGVGLGGNEKKGPAKLFKDLFIQAKKDGYHVVAHAGEDVGPDSIWDAINLLHVERIGHGIASINDPELISYLNIHKIPLEICITSNVFTKNMVSSIQNHPVKSLYENGVFITINTDDPTFFNISLLEEYWNLYHILHFTLDEIKQIIINGFEATFMPHNMKQRYISEVNAMWKVK